MYYGNIKPYDIADGPGVRVSLFVSGCTNQCKNCFQPETWNFEYGSVYTKETEEKIIEMLKRPYIKGLTLLGGEPFEPRNQPVVLNLIKRVRKELPDLDIWIYSGYCLEEMQATCTDTIHSPDYPQVAERPSRAGYVRTDITDEVLDNIDILVDGRFEESLKNISLKFRGSENQRIIDMKKTLSMQKEQGKVPYQVVLAEEYM